MDAWYSLRLFFYLKMYAMEKKKNYTPICFNKIHLYLESSLVVGSGQITGGTTNDEFNPDIEDWGAELGGGSDKGDL